MLSHLLIFLIFGSHIRLGNPKDSTKHSTFPTTSEFSSTSEFTTEFDYNVSTFFNTTEIPPNVTSKSTSEEKLKFEHDQDGIRCLCDLRRNVCDVGCCCDKDCTYEMKMIFENCEEVTKMHVDRTSCQYYDFGYENFTMHQWEIQNNDFLCVAKTNLPPAHTIQTEKPFRSYAETRIKIKTGGFWPRKHVETTVAINISESYTQGAPLKYIANNSSADIFKLGESFFTSGCDFQSNVTYLHDFERHCVLLLDGEMQYLNANFYGNILFIAKPNKFNITTLKNKFLTCPDPICLKPRMKICTDVFLRNCTYRNESDIKFRCDKNECVNILDSFKFIFTHNGIEGIKKVTLSVHLMNSSYESIRNHEINQKISVVYKWDSEKTNYSDLLSGNPGYLIGKPILIGNLVNESISRDSEKYPDIFLALPYEEMGICEIGEYAYQPIEFGYSTILLCTLKGSLSIQNITKPEEICRNLQLDIFKYWSIKRVNGYFMNITYGVFGNANASILDDWREILFEKHPKEILANITGRFSNKNRTIDCRNLVFGLNIDIYHAKVDLQKLLDQEKILAITNQFHSSPKKNFSFNIDNKKISYEIDLDTRVVFWDITSEKVQILLDPPSLNIELPSDFFYPFVKMRNGYEKIVPKLFIVYCSVLCQWI